MRKENRRARNLTISNPMLPYGNIFLYRGKGFYKYRAGKGLNKMICTNTKGHSILVENRYKHRMKSKTGTNMRKKMP